MGKATQARKGLGISIDRRKFQAQLDSVSELCGCVCIRSIHKNLHNIYYMFIIYNMYFYILYRTVCIHTHNSVCVCIHVCLYICLYICYVYMYVCVYILLHTLLWAKLCPSKIHILKF